MKTRFFLKMFNQVHPQINKTKPIKDMIACMFNQFQRKVWSYSLKAGRKVSEGYFFDSTNLFFHQILGISVRDFYQEDVEFSKEEIKVFKAL
jgi:hypothetical protein